MLCIRFPYRVARYGLPEHGEDGIRPSEILEEAGGGKPPGPEVPRDIARTGNSHAGTQGLKLALNVSAGQDCKGRGRGLEI